MKGRVRWNEANLCEIEANKPVRKKILEPKTPYHPLIKEDGKDYAENIGYTEHAGALRNALNGLVSSGKYTSHNSGWTSSEDEPDIMEEDKETVMKFKERRRVHYDGFGKVRELRQKEFLQDREHVGNSDEELSNSSSSLGSGLKTIHIDGPDHHILRTIEIQGGD